MQKKAVNTDLAHAVASKFIHTVFRTGILALLVIITTAWFSGCSGQPDKVPGVKAAYNIPYIRDGLNKHKLDLFLPARGKDFPMVVFIHGGGWHYGDRQALVDVYGDIGRAWAARGIGVAVISYRLGDSHPIEEQVSDVAAAISWVWRRGKTLNADMKRFFLCGHSAGAHLAALVAIAPEWLARHDMPRSAISGLILWSGLYDVPDGIATAGRLARKKIWYPVFGRSPDAWKRFSPIHLLGKNLKECRMKFMIVTARHDLDVAERQSRALSRALRKHGCSVKTVTLEGENHFGEVFHADEAENAMMKAVLEFTR